MVKADTVQVALRRPRTRLLKGSAFPLSVFAATQGLIALWVVLSSGRQKVMPLGQVTYFHHAKVADPGYWEIITNWDGQWYELIALDGYQVPSQSDPLSKEELWAWSFPPLYPMLVRVLMLVTRLPYAQAAFVISVLAGAAAVTLFFHLMKARGGERVAQVATVLFCCFTSAPLLQFAYSESLGLLLLMLFFLALRRRAYGFALMAMVALSFTRLVTAPLLVVLVAHAVQGYRRDGRAWLRGPRDVALLAANCVYALAGSVAWLLVASFFVGSATGMSRTAAYRQFRLGWFSDALEYSGVQLMVLLVLILVLIGLFVVSPRAQPWGLDLRVWTFVYPLYLAVVTIMQPGILRYLLLAPTLPMLLVGQTTRLSRRKIVWIVALAAFLLVTQYFFVSRLVVIDRYGRIFGP
jgi:hypothetical protein